MSAIVSDGLFHVLFVTTPARMLTPRFKAYFAGAALPSISLKFVLKRREPKQERDERGGVSMGWTERCSEEEFAAGARALAASQQSAWINVEGELRPLDLELLAEMPELGAVVSGHGMSPAQAWDILAKIPAGAKIVLALENEEMIVAGGRFIASGRLDGLVIGTSYLSESSKIYDQMGLEKYRLLMRGLGKKAASSGVRPYTTSNYCTFEASGLGDKNKSFVAEQVDFVSSQGAWGSLTRFYSHLDVAQKAREASEHARSTP